MHRLPVQAPFHLEATVRVLQRRPSNRVDVWQRDSYLRVLDGPDATVLAEVHDAGSADAPELRCSLHGGDAGPATRRAALTRLRRILGLDVDPAPLERARAAEPALDAATRALRGLRPPRYAGLFEAFASVVPFQQVSIDAGTAVTGRLVERFGVRLEHDGRQFHGFPTAAAIAEARTSRLRECGLSARKAETLRGLGAAVAAGTVSEPVLSAMSTADALRALTALPGIGPWSAALVLLRGLGRLEVFPPGDVGARRSLRALMPIPSDTAVEDFVGRFGEQRGYVYFCGLGSNLLARGLIRPR